MCVAPAGSWAGSANISSGISNRAPLLVMDAISGIPSLDKICSLHSVPLSHARSHARPFWHIIVSPAEIALPDSLLYFL